MSDPLSEGNACACGWPRPLIAVTTASGELPRDSLSIRYDCPRCGRMYTCGEVPLSTARRSERARALTRPDPISSRKL